MRQMVQSQIVAATTAEGIVNPADEWPRLIELEKACLKLQAAAQGPGIRSEAFARALGEAFALLPDNTPALGIQVEDTFAMTGVVGG